MFGQIYSQTTPFKNNLKWGIKQNDKVVIDAVYDTIFNFDISGRVCLGCVKFRNPSPNKFIKVNTTGYVCNYVNSNNKILTIKNDISDTCSVFSLSKNSVKELYEEKNYFIVTTKNKKYLINKNFNQLTFKGYTTISLCTNPNFLIVEQKQDGGELLSGLINLKEEIIIDYNYSGIKVNTIDSLIVGCSAGVRVGADDDVYDYSGKKVGNYKRHIDIATKKFIIHKIFEPNEYYIVYNIETKQDVVLNASEIKLHNAYEILIKLRSEWFIYNLTTNEKKSLPH